MSIGVDPGRKVDDVRDDAKIREEDDPTSTIDVTGSESAGVVIEGEASAAAQDVEETVRGVVVVVVVVGRFDDGDTTIGEESSPFLCLDGKNARADELSFRFRDADCVEISGAGIHGSDRGDDGKCKEEEVTPMDVFKGEDCADNPDFLSIRVTIFPMSVTCFCKCEKSENS